jgi:PKD repeat protein
MRSILLAVGAVFAFGCDGKVGEPTTEPEPGSPTNPTNPDPTKPGKPGGTAVGIGQFDCTPLTGFAPLDVSCRVRGTLSMGNQLRCELTVNDNRPPVVLDDCGTEKSATFRFDKVGVFGITLKVTDPTNKAATQTIQITVEPPPNQPPVIASFTANPAQGSVPLNTQLTFSVSDPENDPLTCAIDIGSDGTLDYPMVDCAQGKQAHRVDMVGTVSVTLVVKDSKGGETKQTLMLTVKMPMGDVKISKVEWGQSVFSVNPRLVGEKPALLRVHVISDTPTLTGVAAEVEGFSMAGMSLGKVTLQGPSSPPAAEVPADLTKQFTGTIPGAWIVPGLEVRIKVDPADMLAETDEMNNLQSIKPTVGKATVLQVTSVPVVNGGQTGTPQMIEPFMVRIWPLKGVESMTRAPYTFSGTISGQDSSAWSRLLQAMQSVRSSDGSNRNYYGFVKVNYRSGIAGIGFIGQEAATGRDDSTETTAHEFGHNLGRNHAPCGGAAGADPNYPDKSGRPVSWGYDTTNNRLIAPTAVYDLMSYCNPTWVSEYNYKAAQSFLERQPFVTTVPPAPFQTTVLIAGSLWPNGDVTLRPVMEFKGTPTPLKDNARLRARLLLANGTEKQVELPTVGVSETDELQFTEVVAIDSPLRAVQIIDGTTIRLERSSPLGALGAAGPVVQRIDANRLRVRWDATQLPNAQIAHFDEAGRRTTLAFWLEGGDVEVRTDGLRGGHYEASASDGVASVHSRFSDNH